MNTRGFTLIEVLIAIVILGAAALGTGSFLATTTRAMGSARVQTTTASLAVTRLEQLRALDWTFDAVGAPLSDVSTDLSPNIPSQSGTGLARSPADALERNTPGFVDFLDDRGDWVGSGSSVPPSAMFVRRWSVDLPADGTADTLILQVVVRRVVDDVSASGQARGARGESRFVTVKTRTAR
ncbi:MAG: type II secretion system protein [Vicinamibacterales bacterium]